jgi:sensor histidine kinase YesM
MRSGTKANQDFQGEIKLSFLRHAFVPLAVAFALFCLSSFFMIRVSTANNVLRANEQIRGKITEAFESYRVQARRCATDRSVVEFLEGRGDETRLYREFYAFNNGLRLKSLFYLVDAAGRVKITNAFLPDREYMNASLKGGAFWEKMRLSPGEVVCDSREALSAGRFPYSFGSVVCSGEEIIGYILYDTRIAEWNELMDTALSEKRVITDRFDNIIVSSDPLLGDSLGKFRPDVHGDSMTIKGNSYFIHRGSIDAYGVAVYTLSPIFTSGFMSTVRLEVFIAFGLVIIGITLRMADAMSRKNAKALKALVYGVGEFKRGHLDYRISLDTHDEFFALAQEYNHMIERVLELMSENRESADRQRLTEIAQLEEQFNPHFMFNMLETIKYLVLMGGEKGEIARTITSLANLLRYSINRDKSVVRLGEDIDYLRDYLSLQKIRFGENLEYDIQADDGAEDWLLPKLLVQPLVENSIKYGYAAKASMRISVSFRRSRNDLYLIVADNGDGMSPEVADMVRRILRGDEPGSSHIGMYNVQQRVRLLYGNAFGIAFSTMQGQGTEVRVKVPYREEKEYA